MTLLPLEIERPEPEILTHVESGVGVITLNRPRALNALSLAMIRGLWETLLAWRNDSQVRLVLLQGAGEKAFCAGG
ncbi:Enoyl-CoA hydratase/isomerase family domain protein [Candidatus Bealeia paramacronuclearis]|uniref:Enoyl-CoA hydratase/isomerase family domain protein n=1 Tax=Candidatus Bealeia paramacronuclearis TaxID=1921001 RepID=A0ABZ2C153_9PROT|nr:Enoyl-CoA hydratase/isomerase family domain protein [Candidatus Bealeia paramacronuclearis]